MAVFDAKIFESGHLIAQIPATWQSEAASLNLEFMLPIEPPVAWVSAYLPMNAAIRALFGAVAFPQLTGPVLAAASILLLWSITRRIWPTDRAAGLVAVLMLVGSGQFILSGMSAYAMSAHLFFNLVWLRLFIARKTYADLLALVIGFVATGLHQPLFHPLFVAPFFLMLLQKREWARLGVLVSGYIAIATFWYLWPQMMLALALGPVPGATPDDVGYLKRLAEVFHFDWSNLALLALNLVSFFTWQHLLLVPLLIVGIRAARSDPLMVALATGLTLPFVVMTVILPYQGFGFGYRYAHGVLGNVALLAGYAWHCLEDRREHYMPLLRWASVASLALIQPLQMWSSYSALHPFAQADRRITRSGADYMILEPGNGSYVENLAFNYPDLSNRPIRVMADRVVNPEGLARRLCKDRKIVARGSDKFYQIGFERYRIAVGDDPSSRRLSIFDTFEKAGCIIRMID